MHVRQGHPRDDEVEALGSERQAFAERTHEPDAVRDPPAQLQRGHVAIDTAGHDAAVDVGADQRLPGAASDVEHAAAAGGDDGHDATRIVEPPGHPQLLEVRRFDVHGAQSLVQAWRRSRGTGRLCRVSTTRRAWRATAA